MNANTNFLAVVIIVLIALPCNSCVREEKEKDAPKANRLEESFPRYPKKILTSLESGVKLSEIMKLPINIVNKNFFLVKGVPAIRVQQNFIEKLAVPWEFEANTLIFFEYLYKENIMVEKKSKNIIPISIKNSPENSWAYEYNKNILFIFYAVENRRTCAMHPHVISGSLKNCPICSMELVDSTP